MSSVDLDCKHMRTVASAVAGTQRTDTYMHQMQFVVPTELGLMVIVLPGQGASTCA